MRDTLTLKNYLLENKQHFYRVIWVFVIVLLLIAILLARLIYLQVYHHNKYVTLSHNNRIGIIPIAPTRGLIFDRNGKILARNRPSFSLEIVPERIANIDETFNALSKILTIRPEDFARFKRLRKQKRIFDSIPLINRMTPEQVARFSVEQFRFPGVSIEARLTRYYPHEELFSHALGYVGRISNTDLSRLDEKRYRATHHVGKIGIERFYENQLHGTPGFQQVELNARRRIVKVLEKTAPSSGLNLHLTLDLELQKVAQEALAENRGAAVALDVKTGAVLAMVSTPSYNPNLFVNGIDSSTYKLLRNSKSKPLFNRVLQGRYPPGSTIKPIVALAGLEYGVTTPEYRLYDPGWYQLPNNPDHFYRDWQKKGHGMVNLDKAIAQSCDTYFYHLSHKLGINRMYTFMSSFGFGKPTQIDISEESVGLMPSAEWKRKHRKQPWFPGETLITGIGQGFMLSTPIQLTSAIATLANRGKYVKPYLVEHINEEDEIMYQAEPSLLSEVTLRADKHWDIIHQAMKNVVHSSYGTARGISYKLGYMMAGKSGTAQVVGIKQNEEYDEEALDVYLRDHALFVAFAPLEDPKIAAAVIVENGGSGSRTAAPIVRKIIDAYMKTLSTEVSE